MLPRRIHAVPLDQVPKLEGVWRTTTFDALESGSLNFSFRSSKVDLVLGDDDF